ncbi:NRPS [Malassezia obtusa]|uniref:NRPS n=1 Tax=Malassezia obtusa TaxID=76774 RepID=A0AAF0E3D4_9BASI|nr:NRPS [Malassezia obtusa]
MERVPFPDVSGLRVGSRQRKEFHYESSGRYLFHRDLHVIDERYGAPEGTAVAVAWGVVLRAYLEHEVDQVAFDYINVATKAPTSEVVVGDEECAESAMNSVAEQIRHPRGEQRGTYVLVYEPAGFGNAFERRYKTRPVTLQVCRPLVGNDDLVDFKLWAPTTTHCHDSARFMLKQFHAVLDALKKGESPRAALDAPELSSLRNSRPRLNLMPMGPGGVDAERLEDQFVRHAAEHPDIPALACRTTLERTDEMSYAELDRCSDAIAAHLWTHGVGYACATDDDDEIVAMCMPKTMYMYAAILGVLKAGAAWCPIDEAWPRQRQEALLAKSGARVVLVDGAGAEAVAECAPAHMRAVHVAEAVQTPRAEPPRRSAFRASPDRLAYKIWTSGTTGLPKAVGIEHRAAVQGMRSLCMAVPRNLPPGHGLVRYLQFAAYVFDLSIFDIFYAWAHHGTVCFAPLPLLLGQLAPVARALEVTHTLFTPAVSAMVPRREIPTMRVMINGGEKLTQAVFDEWTERCQLINIYGPAEATLSITIQYAAESDPHKPHNIGRPLMTGLVVVVDRKGRVAPRGAVGELLLGGPQLARGYIGDPDKTRDKFFEHPTLGRLYRTGDLVRCLWDGLYEYLGRNDDQVKINGVRIELLEINSAVKSADKRVRDADTVALPGPDGEPRIVSFVVEHAEDAGGDGAPTELRTDPAARELAAAVRKGVEKQLPSYMVPNHFLILPAFPRTSSAKIDRVAIRRAYDNFDLLFWEVAQHAKASTEDDVAVLSHPLARALHKELVDLLPVRAEQITVHAPFAAIGLNSVRAMALAARLAHLGLGAADFVRHDSIAKLVAAASHADTDADARAEQFAALRRAYAEHYAALAPDATVLPATPLQQSMLLESAIDARRYWLHRVVPLRRAVGVEALRDALRRAADAFECLRTGFLPVKAAAEAAGLPGSTPESAAYAPLYVAAVRDAYAPPVVEVSHDAPAADALDAVRTSASPTDGTPPVRGVLLHAADGDAFVLCAHHAVYDAETLERVLATIDAALAGEAPADATPPFSAALPDLVPLVEEHAVRTLEAWRAALAAYPRAHRVAMPRLLDARPRGPRTMQRMTHVAQRRFAELEETAAALETSVRPVVQVAWARVLSAFLETPDVLVGDAVSLRSAQPHYAHVGGPLLATLPVPVHVGGTAKEAIQRVHRFHTQMLDHAHVPLAFVRDMLQVPSDRPLLESVFVLEAETEDAREGAALDLAHTTDLGIAVEHGLALEVRVQPHGAVHLVLNYDTAHVSEAYAQLLLRHVDEALTAYVDDAETDVVFTPDDPALVGRSEGFQKLPLLRSVLGVVERIAAEMPDACAVEVLGADPSSTAPAQTITYAELLRRSSAVAAAIHAQCPAQAVVGVALPRSVRTYIALLGVLRAGRVYLPLDESLPPARRERFVKESHCQLVISEPLGAELGVPQTTLTALEQHGAEALPSMPMPQHAAYLLFTSGTTGTPKGCLLSHANLASAIANFRARFDAACPGTLDEEVRFLARSAEAFDVHLLEALLPLSVGGTVVTMPRSRLLRDLGEAIDAARATHACVVPSLFMTHGRRVVPEDVPTLRLLVVGGEKIDESIIDAWGDAPIPVLNAYGPTEATIGISCADVTRDLLPSQIGPVFETNQFVVLTGSGAPDKRRVALRGEAGELCIIGSHVGLGYANLEAPWVFCTLNSMPAYATGDRARLAPDGSAEYLGRTTASQVKVRGARVELDEVTEAVRGASGCAHAATLLLTHPTRAEPHLVAFVARDARVSDEPPVRDDGACDVAALLVSLRTTLSTYMVPSAVVPLTSLPLARVDTHALRALYEASARDSAADDAPPSTDAERRVADAVRRVLELEQAPGVHTDFFGLGLDSIRAVRLVYALEEAGVRAPLAAVLAHPTVAEIARAFGGDAGAPALPDAAVEVPVPPGALAAAPCVPMQVATLAQTLGDPGARLYINHVRLPRGVKAGAWARAMSRHGIYRTVFHAQDETFVQAMYDTPVVPRRVRTKCTDAACDAVADEVIRTLTTEPPVRVIKYDDVACVTMHHAVYDAASIAMLAAEAAEAPAPLPSDREPVPSDDAYLAFARRVAATEARAAEYWAASLEGMVYTPCPVLTGEYEAPAPPRTARHVVGAPLSAVSGRAQAAGVSLHALFLSSFCALLAQYVGEAECTVGLVLSGRLGAAEHAGVHGPCITTVPFRWTAAADALRTTHRRLYEMLPHQFVRLASVARAVQCERLFDVLFSYLPEQERREDAPTDSMRTGFPLALEVQTHAEADEVTLELVYAPERIPDTQAAHLLAQLGELLGSARPAPRSLVHPTPHDTSDTFLGLFASHVQHRPAADAVVFASSLRPLETQLLTYADLDKRSTAYARKLVRAGKKTRTVLVHLTRSIELYVVLLAVWKAGKTYVPLDPTLPKERLAYMANTVGGGLLVSDAHEHARPANPRITPLPLAALQAEDTPRAPPLGAYAPPPPPPRMQRPARVSEVRGGRYGPAGAAARSARGALAPRAAADDAGDADVRLPAPSLAAPAYILFTSGSTGKPKGVQIGHRALSGAIASWRRMLPYRQSSRMLQLASPGFDVSLFEVCMPLALGFAVASAPKDVLLADLEHAFHALRITVADVPAALASLLHPARLPPLEWLMSGGDVIDERVVRAWSVPPHRLVNAYGPTEGTIGNTLGFMTPRTRRSVVGHVYPATTLLVLPPARGDAEADATPVFAGAVGELVVAGPQVADAYVGAPELTAERFPTLGARRVYRTGDRGRLLCDGRVEVLGRLERGQVKINGQRVELDEIAHELAVEPGVHDAHVQYIEHPKLPAKQLVAYVALAGAPPAPAHGPLVLHTDSAAHAAAAVRGASKRLAAYMVPAHTLVLAHALPLTPNNKVDAKRLTTLFCKLGRTLLQSLRPRAPGAEARAGTDAEPPTLGAVVRALQQCGVADVDVDASFYAHGLDSLSAIRVVRALREAHWTITAAELLHSGTPRAAAERLAQHRATPADARAAVLPARAAFATLRRNLPDATLYPATPLQTGMLAQTVASGGALYVHRHVLLADAPPAAVEHAWRRLVEENTILRTTFHATEDTDMPWVQAVHADATPRVVHAAYTPPRWSADTLRDAPPHVLHLEEAHGTGTRATLVLHHALYDAHALEELLDDLDAYLGGTPAGARPPYAALLPHLLAGAEHVAHWAHTLAGFDPRPLLGPSTDHAGCTARRTLSTPPTAALAACRTAGVSMHALATLAFAQLLAQCTRTPDVCFGQIVSLRGDVPDAERVVGPALNTVPVRIDAAAASLASVQAATDAGRPHRTAPLRDVQRAVRPPRALFDALLDVQRLGSGTDRTHVRLAPDADGGAADDVHYALNLAFVERPDALELVGTARTAFADAARLDALLAHMDACVAALVAGAEPPADAPAAAAAAAPATAPDARAVDVPDALVDQLRALVAELAGVDVAEVDGTTPLLTLGLDSIASVRLGARARMAGFGLRAEDLAQPTCYEIAASYMARGGDDAETEGEAPASPVPMTRSEAARALRCAPDDVEAVLPLSAGQAMHAANFVRSGYRVGVFSFVFMLPTDVYGYDVNAAWHLLQLRHPVLRTVLVASPRAPVVPVQVVRKPRESLHSYMYECTCDTLAGVIMRERLAPRADFHTRAVADASMVEGTDGAAIIVTLFHTMYDAWSLPLLINDFATLYHMRRHQSPIDMSNFLSVPGLERVMRPYAPARLADAFEAYAAAPPCLVHAPAPASEETSVTRTLDAAPLRAALRAEPGATVASALLAAVAFAVHELTQTAPPVLGVLRLGRLADIPQVERLAAPCLNVLPLVAPLSTTVRATANAIERTLYTQRPLEQAALHDVHRALGLPNAPRWNVLVNVLQSQPSGPVHWPMLSSALELLDERKPLVEHSPLAAWEGAQCYPADPVAVDLAVADNHVHLLVRSRLGEVGGERVLDLIARFLARFV